MTEFQQRRIAILHTGGTIGMRPSPHGLEPCADFPAVLAEALTPLACRLPALEIIALPEPIDSSEATPADWATLAETLRTIWDAHDGFVVLHGTDTMAFSASALSFMLRDLDKPVVFTGAQIAMSLEGSDGLGNVVAALRFAAHPALREICIAFSGKLLRGNRATKVSTIRTDAFDCPNLPPLGVLDLAHGDTAGGTPVIDETLLLPVSKSAPVFDIPPPAPGRIASLRVVPGLAPVALDICLAQEPRAIILECYGSGNVPSLSGATASFLARARARGIAVVARTQVPHGGTSPGAYAAGSLLTGHGVIDGADMTFEAVFAKLSHLIARGEASSGIAAAMTEAMAGERRP